DQVRCEGLPSPTQYDASVTDGSADHPDHSSEGIAEQPAVFVVTWPGEDHAHSPAGDEGKARDTGCNGASAQIAQRTVSSTYDDGQTCRQTELSCGLGGQLAHCGRWQH